MDIPEIFEGLLSRYFIPRVKFEYRDHYISNLGPASPTSRIKTRDLVFNTSPRIRSTVTTDPQHFPTLINKLSPAAIPPSR